MPHALLTDLPALLRAAVPERTVEVRATRKLTYYETQHVAGDSFLCDAQQAAQWIRSGTVNEVKRWLKK
jgi:hypothetical protein